MSENGFMDFQPARIKLVHLENCPWSTVTNETKELLRSSVVHVRPIDYMPERLLEEFRKMGCDAQQFFELDERDERKLGYRYAGGRKIFCEHQVMTD